MFNFIILAKYLNALVFSDLLESYNVSSIVVTGFVLIVGFAIMMLVFLEPEKLNYPSMIGFFFTVFFIFYLVFLNVTSGFKNVKKLKPYNSGNIFSFLSVITLSLECIPIYLPIRYTLKKPRKMMRVSLITINSYI